MALWLRTLAKVQAALRVIGCEERLFSSSLFRFRQCPHYVGGENFFGGLAKRDAPHGRDLFEPVPDNRVDAQRKGDLAGRTPPRLFRKAAMTTGALYLEAKLQPHQRFRTLLLSQHGRFVPENLYRLIELLNLQWLLQNRAAGILANL